MWKVYFVDWSTDLARCYLFDSQSQGTWIQLELWSSLPVMGIWVRNTHKPSTSAGKAHISGVEHRIRKEGQKVLHNLAKANTFLFNTSKIPLSPEYGDSAFSTEL